MVVIYILLGILALFLSLLTVAVIRTLLLKPTEAKMATMPKVDGNRAKAYAQVLSKMVQKETVSSRFDESREKFIEFQEELKNYFPNVFEKCERFSPGNALVLRLNGKKRNYKPFMLMSHHDVVPAAEEGWKYEPFSGHIDERGCIWGRGTVDTKGSLFCELQALEEMIKEGYEPECDIYIMSSCTEEWSGESAPSVVKWMEENHIHLDTLVDEGGMILNKPMAGVTGKYCMVGVYEKGYGDLRFVAKGMGGHSSAPGKNTPIPRLCAFVNYVEKHNIFKPHMNKTVKQMFSRLAPNMNFPMKLIFSNLWLFSPVLKRVMGSINAAGAAMMQTTCAFTTMEGAKALNILPTKAYITANMRFMNEQPNGESIEKMKKIAEKFKIETELIYDFPPCKPVDYKSGAFKMLEETAAKIYPGYGVVPYVMTGNTDAKYFDNICDNVLRFAPLEIDEQQYKSMHSKDENISMYTLVTGVDFYKELLKDK